MKMMKSILLAGGALLASLAIAQAADLPTKKAPVPAAKPNCYETWWTWFNSSAADCPLTYWGMTFYGTVDMGVGYMTNGAAFNKFSTTGVNELISSTSHGGKFQGVPSGLSQSNFGVKWKEPLAGGEWYFIGDVNAGFDPYSFQLIDGPRSLVENNFRQPFDRNAQGDSSRTYGLINGRAYAGFSNKAYGTITYGRQNAISSENVNTYDPFGGAHAFSLIGTSNTLGGGLGVTEIARFNHSIKYMYANNGFRVGALSQIGGYNLGNNAQYAVQGDIGFDWQGFSMDALYSYARSAVSLSNWGPITAANPLPADPQTLKAQLQNVTGIQVAAKYKWEQVSLFGGWQLERFTNPSASDLPVSASAITSPTRFFNGGYPAAYGTGVQGNAFPVAKNQQVAWIGGKWAALSNLDLAIGYYRLWQNDYRGATATAAGAGSCLPATPDTTSRPGQSIQRYGTINSRCSGSIDALSGMIDYKATKRLDVYGGVMWSKARGGLASNFYADSNVSTVAGLRFNF